MSSEFEFAEPDVEGLIAAAEERKSPRRAKQKAKAASKASAGSRSKPKRKAKAKSSPPPKPAAASAAVAGGSSSAAPGLITRGVGAAFRGARTARGFGPWTLAATLALGAVIALSTAGWMRAPEGIALGGIRFEGVQVPSLLQERWLRGFHRFADLRTAPDREVLDAFARHLTEQPSVASVRSVELVWVDRGAEAPPSRQIAVDLDLRRPVLPVLLAGGHRAWVDRDGVVLSPLLPGPRGEPLVQGFEVGRADAMRELLAIWPELKAQLPAGLITGVHLDHPLGTHDQRGIVFKTGPGALLIWGRPGEDRFGLTRERKIRNLVHTISCQGDLSKVEAINVRFTEPFAKDPRFGS